jgi:hypothetical protein
MKSLKDVGLLTLLMLMALSAAGGYFGRMVESTKSDKPEIQVNVEVDTYDVPEEKPQAK